MATVEEIKQDILDWNNSEEDTLLQAFDKFVALISWRRAEVLLSSGFAKLVGMAADYVVFSVGEQTFRVDRIIPDDNEYHEWGIDDLTEVEVVNTTVVEYQPKN